MDSLSKSTELDREQTQRVALDDLLEVEACLREMLQTSTDPTVLQRLFNLHREIQHYVSELETRKQQGTPK